MLNLDLATLRKELQTQDNAITREPLFCVFEKERIWGMESDYSEDFEWINHNDDEPQSYTTEDLKEETGLSTKEEFEEAGWEKIYYVERDKFTNAHLTRKSAEHHIEINGHNLHAPFVYVTSMHRCPEMIALRKALLEGSLYAHDNEPWSQDIENPFTCSCGVMPIVDGPNGHAYQVMCRACGTRGPLSSKKGAAINEWNMQVEALITHRTVVEIIRNRIEIAKAKKEAEMEVEG